MLKFRSLAAALQVLLSLAPNSSGFVGGTAKIILRPNSLSLRLSGVR